MLYFPTGVNNNNETNKDFHFIPRPPSKGELPKKLNFRNYKLQPNSSGL